MEFSTIWAPRILSVLRIVDGLIMLQYGTAKLFGWPAIEIFENLKWLSLFGIAGMFELVGGTLLILGLFTRPVAFILSGEMAAAYFIGHFHTASFRLSVKATSRSAFALRFCILLSPAVGRGASMR